MIKILFVCHGNICRSVAAQYILQNIVDQRGLRDHFTIQSAATSTEEIGNPIYPLMEQALRKMDIPIGSHRAVRLKHADYDKYDLFIGMDGENLYYMNRILGSDPLNKIHLLMDFTDHPGREVDDPWYTRQFSECAEQIAEGCEGVLYYLQKQEKVR